MNLSKIHHVAIICSNYQVSKHFYTEILGFKIIQETYRESRDSYKLDLQIGDNDQIELFSFLDPPARPTSPESCGLRHLAFQVDDLEVTVYQLQSRDVEVEPIRIDDITGKKFTFFRDPDNLPLEIYEK
ncbi:Glyoxalase/bleomycin resistance protein/dioxygenase [Stanieria sp. NIES-3757]|nr:Glyoxalase/bleomycin resistance protein/dioxygenase [Stanieria sp. NIES-3757]